MTETRRRNRKILIALMATVASAAIVVPMMLGLLTPRLSQRADLPSAPTTTAPPLTIKPLPVRPSEPSQLNPRASSARALWP